MRPRLHAASSGRSVGPAFRSYRVPLSGRPLWINPELNLSRAYIAAWLPGSEGEGVADMLFRTANGGSPDFTGRLGFPWPQTAMPVTYDGAGHVQHAVFARGYGLDTRHAAPVTAKVSEDPQIPARWNTRDTFFGAGHVIAPWSIYVADAAGDVRQTTARQVSPGGAVESLRQGPAVQASWTGKGEGSWRIGDRTVDLSAAAAAGWGLSLSFTVRQAFSAPVQLGLLCGVRCGGWLDMTGVLRAAIPDTASRLTIPLACFAARGANLHGIDVPLVLKTAGQGALTLDEVALTPGRVAAPCPGR